MARTKLNWEKAMTRTRETLARPAYLSAPVWAMVVEGFVIVGTITALVLMHQQSRRLA